MILDSVGIVYIAAGKEHLYEAIRSADSVKKNMPNIPTALFSENPSNPSPHLFDRVIPVEGGAEPISTLKMRCLKEAPFEQNLYLDSDTYVCGELSNLFHLLEKFDIAAAHGPFRKAYYLETVPVSFTDFNSGVILYRKSDKIGQFFDRWREFYERDAANDPVQGYGRFHDSNFTEALYHSDLRVATLPPEYNCRINIPGYLCHPAVILHGRTPDMPRVAAALNADKELANARGKVPRVFSMQSGEMVVKKRLQLSYGCRIHNFIKRLCGRFWRIGMS